MKHRILGADRLGVAYGMGMLLLFSALPLACGGHVTAPGNQGGQGGQGAQGGQGGQSGQVCAIPMDSVRLDYTTFDGKSSQCAWGNFMPISFTIEGTITTTGPGTFSIDSCASATCTPMISTVSITTGEFESAIPDGAFVRVSIDESGPFEEFFQEYLCFNQYVSIQNLADWGGVPNPKGGGNFMWLVAGSGSGLINPFAIAQQLACGDPSDTSNTLIYDIRVSTAGAADVPVPQGETRDWTIAAGDQAGSYRVRNVAWAYVCCEGVADSYWISRAGN